MLSHRYGWVPTLAEVPASVAKEYTWVYNVSITHMEILHGMLLRSLSFSSTHIHTFYSDLESFLIILCVDAIT